MKSSPTGALAVKLVGSNTLQATFSSLTLRGAEVVNGGLVSYGTSNRQDWDVSFREGSRATVKAVEVFEQALGQPTLKVRAIKEMDRYTTTPAELTAFKRGTQIYLEPRIVGQGNEVFGRFRKREPAQRDKSVFPPRITITRPNGKELLSKDMEYG